MRLFLTSLLLCGMTLGASAQLQSNLVGFLSFDLDSLVDESGYLNTIFFDGDTTFVCGASGDALYFDGTVNFLSMLGDLSVNRIRKTDFSVSFFFRPEAGPGTYDIVSKREDCNDQHAFAITYTPQTRELTVLLSEDPSLQTRIVHRLPSQRCWYHIVMVRQGAKTILYVDGVFAAEQNASTRVDLSNNAQLGIASGPCVGLGQVRFHGAIDEFRVYDRALPVTDVESLFIPRDLIYTRDTVVYLGQDVDIRTSGSCATSFAWTPTTSVDDPTLREPTISPVTTGRYQVQFQQGTCIAIDTIYIEVVDPDDLDCSVLLVPSAFTPNGDNLNEEFGISNPLALEALDYFEIYDRWGTRVYSTTEAAGRWDGQYQGQLAMPGVYVYKARYLCKGEYLERIGSFTLIR